MGAHTAGGRLGGTALGLIVAGLLPEIGDEHHPVARFGRSMTALENVLHRDERGAGVLYAGAGVALGALMGRVPVAVAVASTSAGGQLRRVASEVGARLDRDDLDGARALLPSLVGRDPAGLDGEGIAAAAVESVAENSVDAVFGPAMWAAVGGGPGAGAYRAVNTMDAMVGHHSPRYERFGWAAARLDDLANLVPARLFALTVVAVRPRRAAETVRTVRRDAAGHPSPNAGVAEAAVAGALGIRLGGPLRYGSRQEVRPVLGDGPAPGPADVHRAVALAQDCERALIGALAGAALATATTSALRARRTGSR